MKKHTGPQPSERHLFRLWDAIEADAFWRRVELQAIIKRDGYQMGDYARWAADLGVSRATISRDMRWLYARGGPW